MHRHDNLLLFSFVILQQLRWGAVHGSCNCAGSVREVERLEDAVSQAEAARISAEAALAHTNAMQQAEVRTAQQALQAATKDLQDTQARLADLEATNTLLIQEQQVCLEIPRAACLGQ